MPSLFVLRGNDQGTLFELDKPLLGIGRDPSNPIQLHDTEVSRRHAEIRRAEKAFTLVDSGSSNGTFVNNRRVSLHTLESGDEVRIGSTVMLFKGPNEDTAAGMVGKVEFQSPLNPHDDSHIVQSLSPDDSGRMWRSVGSADQSQSPWLSRALSNLEVMYRTTLAVRHTLDIDQLLNRIMKIIFEWVESDRGCILLVENETKRLEPKVRKHRRAANAEDKIIISKTIIDYVMKKGQGVLTSNAKEDDRWAAAQSILRHNIHEAICVPMQGRHNNMVGLIYIDTHTPPERILTHGSAAKFNEEHLKLMIAIGHQAAMAVEDTRYYSELMQAERLAAIGQTIATLSHHIKNILQGIRGGHYLIEMGLADHEKTAANMEPSKEKDALVKAVGTIRKGWDITDKNQNKISSLVMDMLTFSKEREPALEPANLNEVVGDVVELMESRAEEHNVRLVYRADEKMPTLTFDPEGMHRAILNVMTNGIDACDNREQGCVTVASEYIPQEGIARVTIEDNGVGIPQQEIEKIFILFNSSKKGRGTGLGLSVSNKILREHGGKIIVKSEVGKGSRFSLVIPAIIPDDPPTDGDPRRTVTFPN